MTDGEWVLIIILVLGISLGIWVWKKITEPPADPTTVADELTQLLDDFETARDNMNALGDVDGKYCPEAIRLATRIITLLNQYKALPNMDQTVYDPLKAKFEEEEKLLDSWCTNYNPPPLD